MVDVPTDSKDALYEVRKNSGVWEVALVEPESDAVVVDTKETFYKARALAEDVAENTADGADIDYQAHPQFSPLNKFEIVSAADEGSNFLKQGDYLVFGHRFESEPIKKFEL